MKKILSIIILLTLLTGLQAQGRVDTHKKGNVSTKTQIDCGSVQGVFVDEITATSATLHWNTNGAAYYKVQYYNVQDPREKGTLMTNLGSVAVDGLQPCATYKFVIHSKCPEGINRSQVQMFSTLGCK